MDLDRTFIGLGDKPALLIIDMINGFTSSNSPLGMDCPEILAAINQLLDRFRGLGLPIFFTTVIYRNERDAKVFRQRLNALNVLTPDSDLVKIDSLLSPKNGETLIEKCGASAFFNTSLKEQLRSQAVDSLVITGLSTSGCVRATVVDGLQHEFPVVVPVEAVGDRNHDAHLANLHDMHAKYADVLPLKEVLQLLPNG